MTRDDALRKARLLRRLKVENGATEAEADTALRLGQRLIDRHGLQTTVTADSNRPAEGRMSWVYWEYAADEHGLALKHFALRGSISLDGGKTLVLIELRTGAWQVQRASSRGYETVLSGRGLESFRDYLRRNAPRAYTFAHA